MSAAPSLSTIAVLRQALEAARAVRTHDDLQQALDRVAEAISETLGARTVAVHLHRPAWDDFECVTVHGSEHVRRRLLDQPSTWAQWAPFLAPRFERRGAHLVPPALVTEHGWKAHELIVVLMRGANGEVLGLLTVADMAGERGQRADDDLDRLVAIAQIASIAAEQAIEGHRAAGHHHALEQLLTVSSRIADQRSGVGVLEAVCTGIRDALGFQSVAVLLAEDHGLLRPAATEGWDLHDAAFMELGLTIERVGALLQPRHERHGCYLMEREEAEALLRLEGALYASYNNGRGPYAWDRHWLVVPLAGAGDGARMRGMIWADDPADRLLPGREKLQALRLFADQAAAALRAVHDLEATTHRADHDPLTGLANRVTMTERLRHALQRTKRTEESVAVLFIDLDDFKRVNDTHGHAAGDELLRSVASRIDDVLRPGDTVARFGGDEFVVLCEDVAGDEAAMEVAERLRVVLADPLTLSFGIANVTASIGVALPDRPDRSAEALLQAADRAMYEAKAAGRDASRLATPGAGWP